jgi:YD repeat-containing protein
MVKVINPDGSTVRYEYDPAGNPPVHDQNGRRYHIYHEILL